MEAEDEVPDTRVASSLTPPATITSRGPTLTFLFTDIEGSTRLEQHLGTMRYADVRERHRQILRAAFTAAGGTEQGTEGDSFFVTFPSAREAISAAAAAQRGLAAEPWPAESPVAVRIGVHSGEASLVGGSLVGIDINRAARIGAAGHGGQVVVSAVTRALAGEEPGPGLTWADLGEHRLRDLETPERLAQLVIEGLRSEFPRLRGTESPGDLPVPLTTFVGRTREIEELVTLMSTTRLLTLTGPGGTGKTRLALELVHGCEPWFPDGAWFVPLETITDPELVPATIASRLHLADRGGADPVARLEEYLEDRKLLLLLDNFEQVMGAGPLVARLLAAAPRLTVVVTTREGLRVSGEQEYEVPPLSTPSPAELKDHPERVAESEAVKLFLERARAGRPGYEPDAADAAAIAEICYRLDGLPLAIELAAARIRVLSPQAIVARLGQSLTLLAGGARDLPDRQQTLRGAIAWSHELLAPPEQRLFACFSVFAGRVDLEAVDGVCGDPGQDMLDGLSSLVDKSLVRRRETSGEPRFAMFETIRAYAADQLAMSGTQPDVRTRHGRHFLARVQALRGSTEAGDRAALDRLDRDHDDLRAALAWAIESGDLETAVGLSAGLWRFWQKRGYLTEGLAQLERVIAALGPDTPDELRLAALEAHGGLAYWMGDQDRARGSYAAVVEIRRRQGDPAAIARALYDLSFTYVFRDQLDEGAAMLDEAGGIFESVGDDVGLARVRWARSNLEWTSGEPARVLLARDLALKAVEVFDRMGDRFMSAWATYTAALVSLSLDERPESRRLLARALRLFRESGDVSGYTLVLDGTAALLLREGETQDAARVAGQVTTLERTTGTGLNPQNRAAYRYEPRQFETDPATLDAYGEGSRMPVDELVGLALERLEQGAATPG
jgi:predicted ATPase/class 3 adenylate cyclase